MTEVVVVIVVVVVVVVVIDCFFSEISFSRFNLYQSLNYEKRYVYVSISKLFYICKKLRTKRKLLQVNIRISV